MKGDLIPNPACETSLQRQAEQMKPKSRTADSQQQVVRGNFGFWMETPDGHDVHILGDPRMPARTLKALGAMIDAAYKAAKAGKLAVPSNASS